MTSSNPTQFRWLLDTRTLWQQEPFEHSASRALSLLKPPERRAVLGHIFTADRKLRLASYLLKYLAIHSVCRVPWSDIVLAADEHGKPCYTPPSPTSPRVRFNVSHQAGLVALVGSTTETRDVGIDVVSTTERAHRDVESIEKGGFEAWVDIYTEVFSVRELDDIKYTLPTPITIPSSDGTKVLTPEQLRPLSRCCSRDQLLSIPYPTIPTDTMTINSNLIIDAKLRNFYAHWCLKEAYIKMTGEALLADWLCDVEFRRVRPPPLSSHEGEGAWGETTHDFEIWRSGEQVKGVKMELQAFEEGYMIATAATVPHNDVSDKDETAFQDFKKLDLERDIYPATEGNLP